MNVICCFALLAMQILRSENEDSENEGNNDDDDNASSSGRSDAKFMNRTDRAMLLDESVSSPAAPAVMTPERRTVAKFAVKNYSIRPNAGAVSATKSKTTIELLGDLSDLLEPPLSPVVCTTTTTMLPGTPQHEGQSSSSKPPSPSSMATAAATVPTTEPLAVESPPSPPSTLVVGGSEVSPFKPGSPVVLRMPDSPSTPSSSGSAPLFVRTPSSDVRPAVDRQSWYKKRPKLKEPSVPSGTSHSLFQRTLLGAAKPQSPDKVFHSTLPPLPPP